MKEINKYSPKTREVGKSKVPKKHILLYFDGSPDVSHCEGTQPSHLILVLSLSIRDIILHQTQDKQSISKQNLSCYLLFNVTPQILDSQEFLFCSG